MASSSSAPSSWMPLHGVHQVSIGKSLRRSLKARKNNGEPPPPAAGAKRLPEHDFYAFRYNFKPNSIDPEKPGSIDIRKATDSTLVTVEYHSKQTSEAHVFRGTENVAKEWDCVLVYDEELGTLTLEKLDSHVALTHERKPMGARPPPPTDTPTSSQSKVKEDPEAQLEKDLLDLAERDAEGEIDEDYAQPIPKNIAYRQEEEEEDPMEEPIQPIPPPKPPKQHPPPQRQKALAPAKVPMKPPQPQRAEKPPPPFKGKVKAPAAPPPTSLAIPAKLPPQSTSHPLPPKPKAAQTPVQVPTPAPPSTQTTKTAKKRETEPTQLSDAEEEVLEFGQPAKKRTRKTSSVLPAPTPAPLPSSGLALPGTSSSVVPPPPISSASSSKASSAAAQGGNASESEEEEWDEVDPAVLQDDDFFADMEQDLREEEDQGEDIDVDEFEQQMNQEMEEMDDDEEGMMEVDVSGNRGPPLSLNNYARGVSGVGLSDEETSTSEDSDDDD